MTTRRTVLKVEELGARVLPSTAAVIPTAATSAAVVQTTTTLTTWTGPGRFTLTTASGTNAKVYSLQGSTNLNGSTFYSITGTVQTVGNKAGEATGKITISNTHGTLTLSLTGPAQSANAALPTKFTYKVLSATGTFANKSGSGPMTLSVTLFPGLNNSGNFTLTGTVPATTKPPVTKPPVTKPPVTTPTPTTTTGPSWTGQGRYTITKTSGGKSTYTLQGSADFGSAGFFAIGGTIQTVGSKSGQATGRITVSDSGTLTLALTGPTQSANSGLPSKFTYKVLSGTGIFAHYVGVGTIQMPASLWPGYTNKGHFNVAVKPTGK